MDEHGGKVQISEYRLFDGEKDDKPWNKFE